MAAAGLAMLVVRGAAARPHGLRLDGAIGYEHQPFGSPSFAIVGAGVSLPLAEGALEVAGGARLAIGDLHPAVGVSGFARASLCSSQGSWRPALGLELEATTATRATGDPDDPPGSLERAYSERNRGQSLRAAVVIAPARWQWSRLLVGLGSVRLATPLSGDLGRRVYFAIGLLDLGWVL